ncbi:MAG TPA: hypothetical protein VKI19_10910 [Acidimicrobiales bacterium]|nr:hypothetical protein [Acidimicrobiales bacterium]
MNDDELIQRLRRTLEERADSLQPSPGHLPAADWGQAAAARDGRLERPGSPAANGPVGPFPLDGSGPLERQTAEYMLLPPTGPVPITGRARRRPWPVIGVATLAAAAAAAAVVAGLTLSGGSQHLRFTPPATNPPAPQQAAGTTLPHPGPATTSAPATTAAPPAPRPNPVPAGFEPFSVTFVSAYDGWVLGWAPCPAGRCATLAATSDAGHHWAEVGAPDISLAPGHGSDLGVPAFQVRFADRRDGWVYTSPGASHLASRLWSTHDGGTTWSQLPDPMEGATIGDLEAAGGFVHMVVYGPCPAGSSGCQGQFQEEILFAAVGSDHFVPAALAPSVGAGPALSPQVTLWGGYGWLINDNREVVSGARLTPAAGWSSWTAPCTTSGGAGYAAAASATDLAAVCAEGMWGPPDRGIPAGRNWLFTSSDGGASFQAAGPVPGQNPASITVAPGHPGTVVVADGQVGLQATFDGGRTWQTVYGDGSIGFVGFTTAQQGVAIRYSPVPAFVMTRDGGHTWTTVGF